MKDIVNFILALAKKDVVVYAEDGKLKINAPEGALTDAVIDDIKQHKDRLMTYLQSSGSVVNKEIPVIDNAESYPLSSSQRRLWILSQFEQSNVAYNMSGVFIFEGALNIPALEYAFEKLIARHEILRTVFREDGEGQIRQFILAPGASGFRIVQEDLTTAGEVSEDIWKMRINEAAVAPFNLATGPLLHAVLFRIADAKWIFSYTMHHIICDAWSMEILIKELMGLYNAYTQPEAISLPPLRIQYKDYAAWQQAQLSGDTLAEHKTWWLQQFEGELPVLQLQGDKVRPAVKTYNGGTVYKTIAPRISKDLKNLLQQQGSTLFMGLLASVKALLFRYTGQEDIVIGTSIASREHPDLENQIGFYVNTLPLRTRFDGGGSFLDLLAHVKQVTVGAYEHQVYPFDELINELGLQRDMSRSSLFDVMVVLPDATSETAKEATGLEDITVSRYSTGEDTVSKFDLTFFFVEGRDAIYISAAYNRDIYTGETIAQMTGHLEGLLEAMLATPSQPLNTLDYLSEKDKQQLRIDFPVSQVAYPLDKSIVDLFREQALRTPDQTALVFKQTRISYRELNEQTDRLAVYLRSNYPINHGDLVGIMLDRSADMIIALLAILKSGAGYVAIEPDLPRDRKGIIVRDTDIKALITQSDYIFDLDYYPGGVFAIDIQLSSTENIIITAETKVAPSDLAYVIFTSGSTGQPKGVPITHRALVDYSFGVQARTNMRDCVSFGLVSTISADLGNTIIYTSLLLGGTLHVFSSEDVMSGERMTAADLDCIKIVPSHWKALQEEYRLFAPAKCLIFGGEALTADALLHIKQHNATCEVYNHYGPSEATIGKLINKLDIHAIPDHIALGAPFCNSRVYILDEQLQLLPVGVSGEICIGGDGVSAGYLHRPALTAERFVADPFHPGAQLYKTGDIGRWLPDGTIAFMGRKDDQVKIRGYRIEPGEIAAALKTYPGIEDAIVLARVNNTGEKELVAYVAGKEEVTKATLQAHLGKILPSYMLPGYYVSLPVLPLTPNGKVDRKRLPEPEGMISGAQEAYVAPDTPTEEILVKIWEEVLGKTEIGVETSFFNLGGSSLKIIKMSQLVNQRLGVSFTIDKFFEYLTIRDIASIIPQKETDGGKAQPAEKETELIIF